MQEISEMRKADNPVITGYEFHVLNIVTYTCPKYLILPYLKETLEELRTRKPDKKLPRARVGIVGSEIDDPVIDRAAVLVGVDGLSVIGIDRDCRRIRKTVFESFYECFEIGVFRNCVIRVVLHLLPPPVSS